MEVKTNPLEPGPVFVTNGVLDLYVHQYTVKREDSCLLCFIAIPTPMNMRNLCYSFSQQLTSLGKMEGTPFGLHCLLFRAASLDLVVEIDFDCRIGCYSNTAFILL